MDEQQVNTAQAKIESLTRNLLETYEELDLIYRISRGLMSTLDVRKMAEFILTEAMETFEADMGWLYLAQSKDIPLDYVRMNVEKETVRLVNSYMVNDVIKRGKSILFYNLKAELGLTDEKIPGPFLCSLLKKDHEIYGALCLGRYQSNNFFTAGDLKLADILSTQAAFSLEIYSLYRDIENLFEGLVQASIAAIESRDPSTCGHSERVAALALGLAEHINSTKVGPLEDVHFSDDRLKELRYAALLHDFGKIGVQEKVLLKARKLYPDQLELIKKRFGLARQICLREADRSKIEYLLSNGRKEYLARFEKIDEEAAQRLEALDQAFSLINSSNEPTLLAGGKKEQLEEVARMVVDDGEGSFPLIDREELKNLSLPKGSLNAEERREVESHVPQSFKILNKIPWTDELRKIPEIAYGHHEKLDGSGYPSGIDAEDICIQSRMIAICDIYDALTAADRPYKKAVPREKALQIIQKEVDAGQLDPDLFTLFVEGKVCELTEK